METRWPVYCIRSWGMSSAHSCHPQFISPFYWRVCAQGRLWDVKQRSSQWKHYWLMNKITCYLAILLKTYKPCCTVNWKRQMMHSKSFSNVKQTFILHYCQIYQSCQLIKVKMGLKLIISPLWYFKNVRYRLLTFNEKGGGNRPVGVFLCHE